MKNRLLCILLCVAMLVSLLTLTVSAAGILVFTESCDTAVYYGGTYDIVVSATGTNLKYQWQAKGTGSWFDLEDNDAYSGMTTPHLQFRLNETFENGGGDWDYASFRCKVTGDEGTGYSTTYHMYIYSQADLLERLKADPVSITSVQHNAILPNPPEDPIAPNITHLYAVTGEELQFSFDCTPLKQWMLDTELTISPYIQIVDADGMRSYQGRSVSYTPLKAGDKSVIVSLNMKLLIGGKSFGYSDSENYIITVRQPEPIGTATVAVSALNVRSGPGAGYDRIGGLAKGDTVDVVLYDAQWCRILYDDGIGYVQTSSLNFGSTTESRGKVTDVSVSDIALPVVGQSCDTDFTINGNVTAFEQRWWWDKTGNGAADEENCTVFNEGGAYYCRIGLKPAEGYYFPTEPTTVNSRPAHRYTGQLSINGEPYTEPIYCPADGSYMIVQWWAKSAQAAPRQDSITVTYDSENVSVLEKESVILTAHHDTHPDATNVEFQWYVANAPAQWGSAIEGATGSSYTVPTNVTGEKYYRCHITAELDGKQISTPVEGFKTVKVTVAKPPMAFDDIKKSDWFYDDVAYVYQHSLMGGVAKNLFDPNGNCTRAMVVTVLYRMEGSPAHSGVNPFTDVKVDWYRDAVIWAAENKIVNGVGKGKFDPEADVTREQLATILCRYASYKGYYDKTDGVMIAGFKDQDKVSDWALDAMRWAVGVGLIGGSSEKDGVYLMPEGNALRCQVAAILHRFCVSFEKP